MMLWQLKLARNAKAGQATTSGHPKPIIDQDLCIGCSSCVNACDQNVLEIVAGKSTATNLDACTGKSYCADVCPTGACQLAGGNAARLVEVPQIDAGFETNQKGIYAVGELGGMGLIKNAVNEGQLVIEKLKNRHVQRDGVLDLIIVGAGPAGLSAGLAAKSAGLKAVVLEQGGFADTIRRFPNRKIVMAEPISVPMYGSLWISDAPKETLLSVWQTIIESAQLEINENEQVISIKRNGAGTFHVETNKGVHIGQKVLLAIGKRGSPRRLDSKGAELPKVMYSLSDAHQYANAKVLVVGGGDSAAEAAISLSRQEGNEVALSYRKREFSRLKRKNLDALTRCINEGKVKFLPCSRVLEVEEKSVLVGCEDGQSVKLANDYIFALLGGTPPNAFLEKIGVSMVKKEVRVETETKALA
jgi:putative YpdA family bacillithiol system oxidoreductase